MRLSLAFSLSFKFKLRSKSTLCSGSRLLPDPVNNSVVLSYSRCAITFPKESLSSNNCSACISDFTLNLLYGSSTFTVPDAIPSNRFLDKKKGEKSPIFTFFNVIFRSFQLPAVEGSVFNVISCSPDRNTSCPWATEFSRKSSIPSLSMIQGFPFRENDVVSN